MILKTSELTVYFRSRDIFLCIMTQFLNFAFKWASKNIWCLAVWCAVIVWNSTPSDIKWQSLWRWLFFPIQTLRSMFLASVDGANAGGYCSRHIMKLMFPLCCCLLAVFFCLFTFINYLYSTMCPYCLKLVSSVVTLARSFFSVVVIVKFGSVEGFRKKLPVIFTCNQTKCNIFC